MRSELAVHDDVLRGAIQAHGGFLFGRHTATGVCGVLVAARFCGCDAAVAAQRRLQLPVRMDIPTAAKPSCVMGITSGWCSTAWHG